MYPQFNLKKFQKIEKSTAKETEKKTNESCRFTQLIHVISSMNHESLKSNKWQRMCVLEMLQIEIQKERPNNSTILMK